MPLTPRRKAAIAGGVLAVAIASLGAWWAGPHHEDAAARAKMQDVVRKAIVLAPDASTRVALESGEIFVRIHGLEMDVVGVAVPIDASRNRVWLSFEGGYFRKRSVDVLAHELLQDLSRTSPASASAK